MRRISVVASLQPSKSRQSTSVFTARDRLESACGVFYDEGVLLPLRFSISKRVRICAFIGLAAFVRLFLHTVPAFPQNRAPGSKITVSAHLVQIGVIVRDHGGAVRDLQKDDFIVSDEGKQQTISIFATEEGEEVAHSVQQSLPENTFSNEPRFTHARPRSVTMVLLDNLNTLYGSAAQPFESSPYWFEDLALANARTQLMRFIQQMDPHDRIAIYGLSQSLHVLCDFTCDRDQLLSVVGKYDTTSVTNRETAEPGASHAPVPGPEFDATVNASNASLAGFVNERRAAVTMAALQAIAAHVALIPGRKNLVWFTGNLMLSAAAMARVFAPAQISVYPIDSRGLQPRMSMQSLEGIVDEDAGARGDYALAQSPEPIGIDVMRDLADDTGGQAAVNTNNLTGAVQQAIENSSITYTLGFYIDPKSLDGKFHRIKIQVKRAGLSLRYPRGYFALNDHVPSENERHNIFVAAMRSPFAWTGIPLRVQILRSGQKGAVSLTIAGSVDLSAVRVSQENGLRNGSLDLCILEQDGAGNVLRQLFNHLHLKLTEQQYHQYLQSGMMFREQFQAKAETKLLRVLVQDPATAEIGSVLVPVAQVQ